jgi:nitroimidazol reductase NimA-like FMN-containing flavoprotein (pyridoxamine 5'-phosphate oxidase superfamily)
LKPLTPAVRNYIDDAQVCRIATVRADGEPHVIPVCPVFDGDATVFVDLGPKSTTARALEHDARIAVLFDEYADDWSKLRKVLLKCRAEEVTGATKDAVWERIRAKYVQYTTVDWKPRLTMALRIYDWLQEGVESAGR